ncbi:1-acyl-sn-glycerol-3-phosphate acyltransferase [Bacteriovorax sp. Seq25_V]|uniref:lysophospholipid acyltransferase family protein n=1 Tax=Bacteriovorax sp. Seq25_V TaxID=1201288 RepID=UPI000389FC78|nr:1-acylglycerol-3-phosphate O-acyltransferase [Bacteriovorax sp. Seq25_V]EQC47711.1 putative 1-acyl-sn-glycerol-3-phosphate acyltransferase [Bacteriovorax sp. Seq25_V]
MILKYIRLAITALLIAIFATLWAIICIFRPAHPGNTFVIARIFGYIGKFILGLKVEIEGKERLENTKGSVIISNHQSNYDMFYVGVICPRKTVSVGKKSLLYIPFFGLMYWLSGNILIDRGNRKKAWNVMDKVVETIKKYNCNIWIMPEGTRSKGRGVLPFKKGAFVTAIKGKFEILPIAVSSFDKWVDLTRWNSGTVKLSVLEPINSDGHTLDSLNELKDKAHQLISDEVLRLDQSY